tara:strand:+ start:308 stop:514 length:207 start_codon:yes stop_codon:yes gene_type:complete
MAAPPAAIRVWAAAVLLWSERVEQPRPNAVPGIFQALFNVLAGRAKQRKMRPGIEAQMTKVRWRPKSP